MKQHPITVTFTNHSTDYMLIGNCCEIITVGTEAECEAKMRSISIESSKWGSVEVVAPGQTAKSDMLHTNGVDLGGDLSILFGDER